MKVTPLAGRKRKANQTASLQPESQENTMELARRTIMAAAALGLALSSAMPLSAVAQMAPSSTTPDAVESSIGTLQYKDGAPSKETVAKVYDYLDLMHDVEAFVNAYQGASVAAIFKGCEQAGVPDNTAIIWSELMDAKSLFLTANADTIYFWVNLNVSQGPLVIATPPLSLGVISTRTSRGSGSWKLGLANSTDETPRSSLISKRGSSGLLAVCGGPPSRARQPPKRSKLLAKAEPSSDGPFRLGSEQWISQSDRG
jgi:hypothetical protein